MTSGKKVFLLSTAYIGIAAGVLGVGYVVKTGIDLLQEDIDKEKIKKDLIGLGICTGVLMTATKIVGKH